MVRDDRKLGRGTHQIIISWLGDLSGGPSSGRSSLSGRAGCGVVGCWSRRRALIGGCHRDRSTVDSAAGMNPAQAAAAFREMGWLRGSLVSLVRRRLGGWAIGVQLGPGRRGARGGGRRSSPIRTTDLSTNHRRPGRPRKGEWRACRRSMRSSVYGACRWPSDAGDVVQGRPRGRLSSSSPIRPPLLRSLNAQPPHHSIPSHPHRQPWPSFQQTLVCLRSLLRRTRTCCRTATRRRSVELAWSRSRSSSSQDRFCTSTSPSPGSPSWSACSTTRSVCTLAPPLLSVS